MPCIANRLTNQVGNREGTHWSAKYLLKSDEYLDLVG